MSKLSNCLLMLEYLENGRKYNIKELAENLKYPKEWLEVTRKNLKKQEYL